MNKDDIRLNKAKRDAIKKAFRDTTLKTPTQKDTLLQDAVDTFRELEQSVWDNVIYPTVTKNFPQDDMQILKKYSRSSGGYSSFAQYDNCFYFKPSFSDDSEKQYCWNYNRDDMTALYYNDLMSKGVNPNLYYEFEGKDNNPHYYQQEQNLKTAINDLKVAKYTGQQSYSHYHDQDIKESDIGNLGGHYLLVPQGSCHSRVMMIDSESDFEQLRAFNKSKTIMHNAQKDIFKEKIQEIEIINSIVDQSKFLSEVKNYWVDLDDCVNFDTDEIGTAISIISEEAKQRLLDSAKIRQAQRDNIVAVITTPKEKSLT
jgi:hypothetical protein